MQPPTRIVAGAVAIGALLVLGALLLLPFGSWALHDDTVHQALIAVASFTALILGILGLRAFYRTGAWPSLGVAVAMTVFAAIYVWHGIFTGKGPAFAFLIYGPTSRLGFALALPILALNGAARPGHRMAFITGTLVGGALLAALGAASYGFLANYATTHSATQMQIVRITVESLAALIAAASLAIFLQTRNSRLTNHEVWTALSIFLFVMQGFYFLVAGPWTILWWAAHALGASALFSLTLAVLLSLQAADQSAKLEQLRRVNRLKTNFINSAAHELGTPLTPIRIQLALLKKKEAQMSPEIARGIDVIHRNVDRLVELTASILESARAEAGQLQIKLEPTNLFTVLEDIQTSHAAWCSDSNITMSLLCDRSLSIRTDSRRLQQIVGNFVSNALKHTPRGGWITIEASQSAHEIRVAVTDSGTGLTLEQQEHLFEPFAQVDQENGPEGTGLGLYIARHLARRLGGDIGVTSPGPGAGATFFATIPLQSSQ